MSYTRLCRSAVAALLAIAVATMAACGDDGGGSNGAGGRRIDVGTTKVEPEGDQLKIAYFQAATNNSYLQAQRDAAQEWAKRHPDVSLQLFDGKFDATTQFNQIQNAIQSGRFNAFVAQPNDGRLLCNALSKDAAENGIVVSVVIQAMCGNTLKDGDDLWTPGTLNFVGGTATPALFKKYMDWVVEQNPGPQKVLVLTGPALLPPVEAFKKALGELKAEQPQFKIVGQAETDFSVPVAQQKMAALIQAHPDATILLSEYSNLTRGAAVSLKQAGKLGKIKIYDSGGTRWSKEAVEDGTILATTPNYVKSPIYASLDSLLAAFKSGKPGERFIKNDGVRLPPEADKATGLVIYTKDNIDGLKPEAD